MLRAAVLVLVAAAAVTATEFDPTLLPFRREEGGWLQVGFAQGLAEDGTNVVSNFELTINVDVDETVGLGDYQAQSPLTWKGKTEIRPKIVWADPASRPWNDITLLISTLPCDEDDAQLVKDAQVYAPAGGGKPYEWPLNVMDEGITSPAGVTDVTLHFYDECSIVDTDQAKCAVFVQGAQPNRKIIARGSISPPFPKFPDEFYTGIDVNIVNKGYSYTVYESYDRSCDAALQEILLPTLGHTRYLYDYKNQKLWTIRQGTPEKPGGTCSSRPLDPKDPFVKEDGVHLTNAQHFLGLNPNSEYQTRESEGYPTVRGVPVDTYSNFNNFRDNQTDATLSLGVKYKFAVPSWRSGARTDFRPLQEVELFGAREAKADNDKPREVQHVYSFFDFQPFVPDSVSFEPCIMLPQGEGCQCLDLGCVVDSTDGRRQQEQRAQPAVNQSVSFDVQGADDEPCPTPSGYMDRDRSAGIVAGAFVGSVLVTAIVGALAAMAVLKRRQGDVEVLEAPPPAPEPQLESRSRSLKKKKSKKKSSAGAQQQSESVVDIDTFMEQ